MFRWSDLLDRSPLTDPRSVGSSLLFHAVLLVVASVAALSVSIPAAPELSRALRGELDSVDNRAARDGGGSPGELGGEGMVEALPSASGPSARGESRDPAADALLSEILPSPMPSDAPQRALPGPQTSGMGILPGPGTGGGGGSGGGSGGGVGRGIGPGTEFFGAREHAGSFAYVIDCSGSMATRNALDVAKRELLASLGQLPPDASFSVVFYSLHATMFTDQKGERGMMAATVANKARVRTQLDSIVPDGGTDHMQALRAALKLHPEVIFFLTDADLMTNTDVVEILAESGKTRIQAIEFGQGPELGGSGPLKRLASTTGGSYRYFNIGRFPKR